MTATDFINSLDECKKDISSHLHEMHDFIESIRFTHKEYYDWLEDADLHDIYEIKHLIVQAPILEIKYWLIGKLSVYISQRDCFDEMKEMMNSTAIQKCK